MAQSSNFATVKIRAVDVFGHDLPYYVESFISNRTGENVAPRFVGLSASRLPFDRYRYRLLRSDLRGEAGGLTGQIDVAQSEVLKVLLGDKVVAFIGGQAASISVVLPKNSFVEGMIGPPPSPSESIWIRLKGLFQNYQTDLTVGPDGSFRIPDLLEDVFILVVLNHETVIGVQLITFKQGGGPARFTVSLKDISVSSGIVNSLPEGH